MEAIYGIPTPDTPRCDLEEIFLQGISQANIGVSPTCTNNPNLDVDLNGQNINANAPATVRPSEQLRLNMAVPPSATPNRLGLLAGRDRRVPERSSPR